MEVSWYPHYTLPVFSSLACPNALSTPLSRDIPIIHSPFSPPSRSLALFQLPRVLISLSLKHVKKLAKRMYGSKGESIVSVPRSLLQSHGEGSAENVVCSSLELHYNMVLGNMIGWIRACHCTCCPNYGVLI